MTKTVLITGCSTGFGKLAAKTFQAKGWNVVATMRSPDKEEELQNSSSMLVTQLDVTDPESIKRSVSVAIDTFGAIDVLVNNAGYGGNALFEQSDDAMIRAMYETNVFGVMNVMREVLPHMRSAGGGVIINVTSMAGIIGLLGNSIYSSSKYAVEGLTEALALEYKTLGIKFHTIAPGAYGTTAFNDNRDDHLEVGDDQLRTHSRKLRDHFAAQVNSRGEPQDPQQVADKIFKCATEEMPVHNVAGADAQMLVGVMEASKTRQDFIAAMEQMLVPRD